MPRMSLPEQTPHEGDAVAMVRVHVRLDLEDEAGHLVLPRDRPFGERRLQPSRRRREFGQRVDEIAHAEIAQRAAEKDRRQMAFEKGFLVEALEAACRQLDLLPRRLEIGGRQAGA